MRYVKTTPVVRVRQAVRRRVLPVRAVVVVRYRQHRPVLRVAVRAVRHPRPVAQALQVHHRAVLRVVVRAVRHPRPVAPAVVHLMEAFNLLNHVG